MAQTKEQQKRAQEEYQRLARRHRPRPPLLRNALLAFLVGGAISAAGQGVLNFFVAQGLPPDKAGGPTAGVMVFLGAFLTALGVYDKIGQVGGAGSAIPITGFANSIVAAAIEFKTEGFVMGMAARMYQIAGPVITYGVTSAIVVGLLRFLIAGG
ncbi:MAG: stage V sporulation protein AC [Bacillota bacterium]|nr:stage V sporulation protein AC [Bacillota bacterium]